MSGRNTAPIGFLTTHRAGAWMARAISRDDVQLHVRHRPRSSHASWPRAIRHHRDLIRKQADAGIDIISDGELGKIGFGFAYYGRRLSGLGTRK